MKSNATLQAELKTSLKQMGYEFEPKTLDHLDIIDTNDDARMNAVHLLNHLGEDFSTVTYHRSALARTAIDKLAAILAELYDLNHITFYEITGERNYILYQDLRTGVWSGSELSMETGEEIGELDPCKVQSVRDDLLPEHGRMVW